MFSCIFSVSLRQIAKVHFGIMFLGRIYVDYFGIMFLGSIYVDYFLLLWLLLRFTVLKQIQWAILESFRLFSFCLYVPMKNTNWKTSHIGLQLLNISVSELFTPLTFLRMDLKSLDADRPVSIFSSKPFDAIAAVKLCQFGGNNFLKLTLSSIPGIGVTDSS